MKILVTGATGYLGSHICEYFKNQGHEVSAYIRNPRKAGFLDQLGISYEVGDIMDKAKLEAALKSGYDAVINSVGYVNDRGSWSTFRRLNSESCKVIGEAMRGTGTKRLIHISSIAAYGTYLTNGDESVPSVKTRWNKYGVTKYEGEQQLEQFDDLIITILRPSHVLGRRDRTGIIPVLYHTARKFSRWINKGETVIPVVYVDDVCQAIEISLNNPEKTNHQIYNVVNEEEIRIRDALEMAIKKLSFELPKKNMSYRRAFTLGWINESLSRFLPIKLTMTRASATMAGKDASFSNKKITKLGWKPTKIAVEMVQEWVDWRVEYEKAKL